MKYQATSAALGRYDSIDKPAFEAIEKSLGAALDMSGFVSARKLAADRVRAAYLKDTEAFSSPENVELMSVEVIRRTIGGTLAGKMLQLLP
jgi:hypothetical protein